METSDIMEATKLKSHNPRVTVDLDSNVVNFGQFKSGHSIKRQITLKNTSCEDLMVNLKFSDADK